MPTQTIPLSLETILDDSENDIRRIKVIGGWIIEIRNKTATSSSSVFVQDPQHDWEVE